MPCPPRPLRACWIKQPQSATAARRAALDILHAVGAGVPFSEARDRALTALPERDRRLAYELSAGVLRARSALDGELDLARADRRLHDVLRLGAYQLRRTTRIPAHAAVFTSVELAREIAGDKAAGYVNQALRRIAKTGNGERGAVDSHPQWLVDRWIQRFGASDTARLVQWNDTKPPLVLQLLVEPSKLIAELQRTGYEATGAAYGAGLRIARTATAPRSPLSTLPGYSEGAFLVQDPAQALIARYANVPAGARLYDACAAPGGKAVQLAKSGVRVIAGDRRRDRIGRLVDTVTRCRVAAPMVVADLVAAPFPDASWDAVLVDAPCTATGTMARHPDARWRISARMIATAAARQGELLAAAARQVRPGGLLVYATCSLEPEENADQVSAFLRSHPEFHRAPPSGVVPAELLTPAGDFQSLPHRHGIDGAFAARLERSR